MAYVEGKPIKQFEFINLSERHQISDADLKRRVRAHAMRDFRSRKGSSEVYDDQGFVKSDLDITRTMKQPSKPRRNRGDQFDGDPTPISPNTLIGDSPSVVDMSMQIEDLQQFAPSGCDSLGEIVEIGNKTPNNYILTSRTDKAPLGRHGTASERHARKQVRRNRTRDLLDSPTTSSSSDSDSFDQPQSPLVIQAQYGKSSNMLSLVRALGSGSTDPFDALPIAGTPRVQALIHHYMSVFIQTKTPMIPKVTWLNEAMGDSALFQATLLPSALHHAMFYGRDLTESFDLFHVTTALVKKKLSDPELGISDNNIAAVICLSFFENVLGNASASNVHMEGLQRMVELRGGLLALGLKGVLQRMVSWADIWNSILSLSKPRFPLIETAVTKSSTDSSLTELDVHNSDNVPGDENSENSLVCIGPGQYQNDVANIFQGLQQLSRILAAVHSSKTKPLDALLFNEKIFVLERRLLLSLISSDRQHVSPLDNFILQSCSHAAFIFIFSTLHSTIRDLPLRAPFFRILIERLRDALDHTGYLLAWSHTNAIMLLWVLVVGAAAACRRPQRPWFVTQLTGVCAILKIQNLDEMKTHLEKMMWMNGALNSELTVLWSELQSQWG